MPVFRRSKRKYFRMFNRLNIDTIIANEGNGIGLHLTRLLMERMAGGVCVESEIRRGITFWVDLSLTSSEGVFICADSLKADVEGIDQEHKKLFL